MTISGSLPVWTTPDLSVLEPGLAYYLDDEDFEYHLPTQVGCPYRCFHCGTGRSGLFARTVLRPIESLRSEIAYLADQCSTQNRPFPRLWVTDETFTSDVAHVHDVCDALRSFNFPIQWRAQTRADRIDRDTLRRMKAAGCRKVAFGVEAPSEDGLELFGKREEMASVHSAFAYARELGIRAEAILVFGAPEDSSEFGETFDAITAIEPDSVQSYIYHPVPGSPWWRKHRPSRVPNDGLRWDALDFHAPPVTKANEAPAVIARFCASLVWMPTTSFSCRTIEWRERMLADVRCYCGAQHSRTRFVSNSVAAVVVRDGNSIVVAAVGPEDAVAVRLDGSPTNIFSALTYLSDLEDQSDPLELLCPSAKMPQALMIADVAIR